MNKIVYYADQNGESELEKYLRELNIKSKTDKNSRIRFNTIHRYVRYLRNYGTWELPYGYAKHIRDDIRELRPDDVRILYFYFKDDTFVLFHHFVRKTRKTPKHEIEKAIKEKEGHVKRNS